MYHQIKCFLPLLLLLVFSYSELSAQETDTVIEVQASKSPKQKDYHENEIKFNISSLALNSYSFFYERCLTRKISASVGYRTGGKTRLYSTPLGKKVSKIVAEEDDGVNDDLSGVETGNRAFTGEVRFYAGRKSGARGFYLSLYGRQAKLDADYPYTFYAGSNNKSYTIPLNGNVTGIAGGLGFGAKWMIGNRVSVDWYMLGAHVGKFKGDLSGQADLSKLSSADKASLKNELEGLIYSGLINDVNVTNTGVSGKVSGPFYGTRAGSITIGISF